MISSTYRRKPRKLLKSLNKKNCNEGGGLFVYLLNGTKRPKTLSKKKSLMISSTYKVFCSFFDGRGSPSVDGA